MNPAHFAHRLTWPDIDHTAVRRLIDTARDEDLLGTGLVTPPAQRGDVTSSLLPSGGQGHSAVVARESLTVCGLVLIPLIMESYGAALAWQPAARDGDALRAGAVIGHLRGEAAAMLTLERVLLNFLQHLSGVATCTARYVAALGDSPTRLLDTRKTTPGWRVLEKYATACGGGWNHRIGLFDRVMLKDNHWAALGASADLAATVAAARRQLPGIAVEIEVDHPAQIAVALAAGADIILLDNFADAELAAAVAAIGGRAATEASGGITIERLPRIAHLGLDFISTGATVHKASWVDIGLDWL
jgi:nicotinate-nucleotide pyrophosphorylase (carboxylating)